MSDPRPGSAFAKFASRGLRSVFSPKVASHAAVAAVVAAATVFLVQSGPAPDTAPRPAASVQTTVAQSQAAPRVAMSYDKAMSDQAAFREAVRDAAAKYPMAGLAPTEGFAETMLSYVRLVQELRSPLDQTTDAMYGLDDAQWAWMMRGHAKEAGLSAAMDGVHVNRDGSVEAKSAQALQNMLALKHDVAAATKLFAAWLSDQALQFDGQTGKAPNRVDLALIAIAGDEALARQANELAKDEPAAKLAPELQIPRGSWKRALFADSKGWKGAADAVSFIDLTSAMAIGIADQPLPAPKTAIKLEEDLTAADFRADPDRLAGIVARTVEEMSPASVYGIHASNVLEVPEQRVAPIMAGKLLTLAASIDKLRGDDLSGGVYAIGPGQWIDAIEHGGDSDIQANWAAGVEMREDGSVHAKSAEAFGSLMRLREDSRIATQIVAGRLAQQMSTLKKTFGRIPHDGMLLASHLYGLAAAETIARASMTEQAIRAPRFSESDPRASWGLSDPTTRRVVAGMGLATFAGTVFQDVAVPARRLEMKLIELSSDSIVSAEDLLNRRYLQKHAGASRNLAAEFGHAVERGADLVNGAVGSAVGALSDGLAKASERHNEDNGPGLRM